MLTIEAIRNGHGLNSAITEIPPNGGAFAAFKVSQNSWRGYKPIVGERRYVMANWLRAAQAFGEGDKAHSVLLQGRIA
jgi:hypothetical protein